MRPTYQIQTYVGRASVLKILHKLVDVALSSSTPSELTHYSIILEEIIAACAQCSALRAHFLDAFSTSESQESIRSVLSVLEDRTIGGVDDEVCETGTRQLRQSYIVGIISMLLTAIRTMSLISIEPVALSHDI